MELRFYKVFGEINIEQLFEKIVKILFGRFEKEVIGSVLYLYKDSLLASRV